ncbi:MAG: hypothetical protein ACJ8AU_11000 [Gemmatimonadales bacterium]
MKRSGLLLLVLVALGFAGGAAAEGRWVARRRDVDVRHFPLEMHATLVAATAPLHSPVPAAAPAVLPVAGSATLLLVAGPVPSFCTPPRSAPAAACSRAPPILG